MKVKEVWKKLRYWQKGGIIGLLTGIFVNITFFNISYYLPSDYGFILRIIIISSLVIFYPIFYIFDTAFRGLSPNLSNIIIAVILLFNYMVVGLIIGGFVDFIKWIKRYI